MTTEKKTDLELAHEIMDPLVEGMDSADDLVLANKRIEELEIELLGARFELEMAYDVSRMGAATEIFAALVAHKPLTKEIKPEMAEHAMRAADTLVSHYQGTMEAKKAQHMKELVALSAGGSGESVQ